MRGYQTTGQPVLLTAEEAAEILHIGRSKVFDLLRTGDLHSVKIGRLRRIPVEAISEFTTRLTTEENIA